MSSEGVMATLAQLVFGVAILGFLWIENRALIWPVLFAAGLVGLLMHWFLLLLL